MLQFRAECRDWAAHWMGVQAAEFRRLGVDGAWRERYATMDLPSEAAIAAEIGKFLLNGALYPRAAPGAVVAGREDRAGRGRDRVPRPHQHDDLGALPGHAARRSPALARRVVVIWTTTPWTMPGNRAIACGADFDYALVQVDSVGRRIARAGRARSCWWRSTLLAAGLQGRRHRRVHHVLHMFKGADLAGTVCAHPLRGRGYDLRRAAAARRLRHHRGRHRLRAHRAGPRRGRFRPRPRARAARSPTRSATTAPSTPGCRCSPACTSTRPPTRSAPRWTTPAGCWRAGKLVHSYPHSWRSKAPLIFRATPQWFIRMDGPERIRAKALAAIDATHVRAGPGAQPARLA